MPQYINEDEVVYDPSKANSAAEYKEILKHNERAKILRAQRRDRERCEAPTIFEKFANGIKNLFGLVKTKEAQHQKQQHSR